jgi:O-antigen ligase
MRIKFIPYLLAFVIIILNTELLVHYDIKVSVVLFGLLLIISFLVYNKRKRILPPLNPMISVFFLFILSLLLTTIFNNNYENVRIVIVITLFFLISIIFLRLFTFKDLGIAFVNLLFIFQAINIIFMALSGEITQFVIQMSSLNLHRINGFISGNNIAGFLSVLGLIINYTLHKKAVSIKNITFLVTLLFSNNRFSFLILFIFIVGLVFISKKKVRKGNYLVVFMILVIFISVIFVNESARFYFSRDAAAMNVYSGDNTTLNGRIELWVYSIEYLFAQPFKNVLFGLGFGNIFNVSYLFESKLLRGDYSSAMHIHNSYVNILFHSGVISFVLLTIIIYKIILAAYKIKKQEPLLFSVITAFLLIGITEPFIFSESIFSLMFMICLIEQSEKYIKKINL